MFAVTLRWQLPFVKMDCSNKWLTCSHMPIDDTNSLLVWVRNFHHVTPALLNLRSSNSLTGVGQVWVPLEKSRRDLSLHGRCHSWLDYPALYCRTSCILLSLDVTQLLSLHSTVFICQISLGVPATAVTTDDYLLEMNKTIFGYLAVWVCAISS